MKINIYLNEAELDINNINVTDFNKNTQNLKDDLSMTKLDFSSIRTLKGDKKLLEKSFQQQKAESLNL
jgi:hypothetical protein